MKEICILTMLVSSNCFLIGIKPIFKKVDLKMNIDSPSKILEQFSRETIGNSWTINELSQKVEDNKVDSVSLLVKDNIVNGLVAIDNNYKEVIDRSNLHPIRTGIPEITNII